MVGVASSRVRPFVWVDWVVFVAGLAGLLVLMVGVSPLFGSVALLAVSMLILLSARWFARFYGNPTAIPQLLPTDSNTTHEKTTLSNYIQGFPIDWLGVLAQTNVGTAAGIGLFLTLIPISLVITPADGTATKTQPVIDMLNLVHQAAPNLPAAQYLIGIFVFALTPAVVEEILFRGILQSTLSTKLPAVVSIGSVAALFAWLHDLNGVPALIGLPILLTGIVNGWLTHRYQTLWPAIVSHFIFNTINIVNALSTT